MPSTNSLQAQARATAATLKTLAPNTPDYTRAAAQLRTLQQALRQAQTGLGGLGNAGLAFTL